MPSKAQIARVVEAARASGLDVAIVEVSSSGLIRVLDKRSEMQKLDEFRLWESRL